MKLQWNQIDWEKAEEQVNRLQVRIVKATLEQKWRRPEGWIVKHTMPDH